MSAANGARTAVLACPSWTAKEIRRFKIALNSGCPLRCGYCFIDKDSGEVLSDEALAGALELALGSPGREKKLLIYGGEPFLEPALLRRAVLRARGREKALGKRLAISVATSGIRIDEGELSFLKRHRVQLAVSVDGDQSAHDRFRTLKGGRGSFALMRKNIRLMMARLPARGLIALLGAHPEQAGSFSENFKAVVALGFENVNIEVIHGVEWTGAQLATFERQLDEVCEFMLESISGGRPLFLESSYSHLRDVAPAPGPPCPFSSFLEVYPSGEYSFYPFPFMAGAAGRRETVIGAVGQGLRERYRDCRYDAGSALCAGCLTQYYRIDRLALGNAAFSIRREASRRFARRVAERFGASEAGRAYLREAAVRDGLGFSQ